MLFCGFGNQCDSGIPFAVNGAENVAQFLNEDTQALFGGSFHVCEDPLETVDLIMKLLNEKRSKLGVNKQMERKMFDMKDRRQAHGQ